MNIGDLVVATRNCRGGTDTLIPAGTVGVLRSVISNEFRGKFYEIEWTHFEYEFGITDISAFVGGYPFAHCRRDFKVMK